MLYLAADLVAPGGPSAPVWTLLGLLVTGVCAIIGQQMSAKKAANEAKVKASEAAEQATLAASNTTNISNGFVGRVDTKLDKIIDRQDRFDQALIKHLEWHVDNKP